MCMCMYYRTTEAAFGADESKSVFAEERHTDENRKRESVCILCVDDSVCKRDNKKQSVCNEGNFESTLCESQQARDRPASVFLCVFVQRKCVSDLFSPTAKKQPAALSVWFVGGEGNQSEC